MISFKQKLMEFIEVLKRRLERRKDRRKDLENLVDRNAASPSVKQRYVETKAKEEELEDVIDLAQTLLDDEKEK